MSELDDSQYVNTLRIPYTECIDQFGPPGEAQDDESSSCSASRRLQCLVCGAFARGYNFGVTACESCKAFFRRNALRQEIRPCSHGGNCDIREDNRKACPACRINKCFEVGMKKELIHPPERLMMRAKPKSWHNRRYIKMDPNSMSDLKYPIGELSSNTSLQNQLFFEIPCKQGEQSSGAPVEQRQQVPKKEAKSRSQESLLVRIIDSSPSASTDAPSGSGATESPATSKYVDVGITCCPMTDIDDSFYFLSSRFHYILGMAKEPFTYNPNENSVQLNQQPDTIEDGFSMYEYFIKRMVSTLVQMPHFNAIDRGLFINIVKEKLFGAAQIFSCLYFNSSIESWILRIMMNDGILKELKFECSTFFYNAFRYLTKPSGMSSVAILKMGDVDMIFKANMSSFKRICALSKNDRVFMIALIGYYLCIDEGFLHVDKEKELKDIMQVYERFLMQMCYSISRKFDVCEFYRDILSIMQVVKWIEARYVDLGKYLDKDRLPPLLKEIMSDDDKKVNTS